MQYSEKDKEDADAHHERTIEAAEAVTKGAREVRQTCEFLRDTASSTAKSVRPKPMHACAQYKKLAMVTFI